MRKINFLYLERKKGFFVKNAKFIKKNISDIAKFVIFAFRGEAITAL